MSRIKELGGCLAVILAIGMVASTAAEAQPEWQKGGKPLTEALTFKNNGSAGQFENSAIDVTWKSVGGGGVIKGTNEIAKLSLIFWESKVKLASKVECAVNSPGAAKGEVVTKELKGSIGYLEKTGKVVGALAEPVSGTTVAVIEGTCLTEKELVTGSVIGRVDSELNKETTSVIVGFALSKEKPEFTKFEGESTEHILHFSGEVGGLALFECLREDFELEGGKKVEIKA
jgi:hypothetical protein